MEEAYFPKKKNIYKKSLAMALIRMDNNFIHSMRNRSNPLYQIFVFEETPKLIEDLLELTTGESQDHKHH